jgi:hypothetical protein
VRLVTNHKVSQLGIAKFLTAPDEAVITFHGKGYTSPEPVIEMAALRCADATLAHGYHYFVITSATDMSRHSLFSTPGYAQTYGNARAFGNFAIGTATTTFTPPQTFHIYKPGVMASIRMSYDEKSIEPYYRSTIDPIAA